MLPQLQKVSLPISHFPTAWQAVIFRNYNKVSTEVLAKVLKTSADVIKKEAERMGLKANETGKIWHKFVHCWISMKKSSVKFYMKMTSCSLKWAISSLT